MNHHQTIATAPGGIPLRIGWPAISALSVAALIAVVLYGVSIFERTHPVAAPTPAQPGWFHAAVLDADSPRARRYSDHTQLPVRLPDASPAAVVVRAGEPQALLLPPSNTLADRRERALQAGGAVDQDRSVVLPAITQQGERFDFVIRADGSTVASVPRYDAANLSAGISDRRNSNAAR